MKLSTTHSQFRIVKRINQKQAANKQQSANVMLDAQQTSSAQQANKHPYPCSQAPASEHHYTYDDCLHDKVPVPHTLSEGSTLFTVLMTGGMVLIMTSINGIRNTGFSFMAQSLWLYPLVFCIAFSLRSFLIGRIVDHIKPVLVDKHFKGSIHAFALTVLNTSLMAPLMCAIVTLLLVGTDDYFEYFITTIPITLPISICINFFIVGPAVKMFFRNRISPAGGIGLLERLSESIGPLLRMLGVS